MSKSDASPSVAVVITTYDHAHYLADALRSVAEQSVPASEVIVVDDGSHDDPAAVARAFGVDVVRQDNAGLAAARNRGLAEATADYVIFLDADDRLARRAIELGLACHASNPRCALVYGAHRRVDAALAPLGPPLYRPCGPSPYEALLRGNMIGSCGTVMFDRSKLAAAGGFDADLRRCEDYDAYLRLARAHPVASHSAVVADYRMHGGNMSGDPGEMLDWALLVHARHRPPPEDHAATAAFRAGRRRWKLIYAGAAWRGHGPPGGKRRMTGRAPLASLVSAGGSVLRRVLPARAFRKLKHLVLPGRIGIGGADLGDLARTEPIGRRFGLDRGTPVDRWFIERFLARHAGDIRGRVLEVGDDSYSRRFGAGIEQQDVLHFVPGHPGATIVGDVAQAGTLPAAAYDCMIVTQTLQLVYDIRAAVANLAQALKPGGVLLLTMPGVTTVDPSESDGKWYWSITDRTAERLFGEAFGGANVEVSVHGNAYAATCYVQGLALEEIDAALLEQDDPAFPMLVCVRARRER